MRLVRCKQAALLTLVFAAMLPMAAHAVPLEGQPIYARNNTRNTIWVACQYIAPGAGGFATVGFFEVRPGQSRLLVYNDGRNIYFYAEDNQDRVWEGNASTTVVEGKTVRMFHEDTGAGYEPWTMNFNP